MRKSQTATAVALFLAAISLAAVPHALQAAAKDQKSDASSSSSSSSDDDDDKSIADQITKATATAPVTEKSSVTNHSVTIKGKKIDYKATAGTLTIRDDDGKPTASVFYVAYTADPGAHRPVTFLYNGGPGSASLGCTWAVSARCG
ncbi:MAG: hypothetical protein WDN06_08780 [Asticcacaulis sp.]